MAGKQRVKPVDHRIPEFMAADANRGLEGILDSDLGWHVDVTEGTEKGEQTTKAFDVSLMEMRPLIDSVLLAIILANGPAKKALSRLKETKKQLGLCKKIVHIKGRKPKLDDASLRKIAIRYHEAAYKDICRNVDLDPIIRAVVEDEKPPGQGPKPCDNAKLIRLRSKFKLKKDIYLGAVNSEDIWEREPKLRAARRIIRDLRILGIPVNVDQLDVALHEPPVQMAV